MDFGLEFNKNIHENLNNTHDWNYDKPYEWGLETLTGKTFVKNKSFWGERKFVSWGSVTVDSACHIRTNVQKKKKKNVASTSLLCYRFTQKLLLLLNYPT